MLSQPTRYACTHQYSGPGQTKGSCAKDSDLYLQGKCGHQPTQSRTTLATCTRRNANDNLLLSTSATCSTQRVCGCGCLRAHLHALLCARQQHSFTRSGPCLLFHTVTDRTPTACCILQAVSASAGSPACMNLQYRGVQARIYCSARARALLAALSVCGWGCLRAHLHAVLHAGSTYVCMGVSAGSPACMALCVAAAAGC